MNKLTNSVLTVVLTASVSITYAQQVKKDTVKTKDIGEVVVTALGVKKEKRSLGYSTQNVNGDEVAKSGKSNVMDALAGKVSGVQITNSGGQAGGGTTVVIRGISSITGNNNPLYVIDGVPVSDDTYRVSDTSTDGAPVTNRATDINPDDVESVNVLKGGAATAIYGIKAQNGVIMITTKKGKAGKLTVDFSSNYAIDEPNKFPLFSDKYTTGDNGAFTSSTTLQWGSMVTQQADGTYQAGLYPAGVVRNLTGTGTPVNVGGQALKVYPKNYENFFRKGETVRNNVTVSGGNESSTFLASASYLDQSGIIPNQQFNRASVLFNITHKLTPKVDVDVKFNYINSGGKFFKSRFISETLAYFNNNYDVNNQNYQDQFGNRTYWHPERSHPQWIVNKTGEDRKLDRFITNFGFNYKIAKGLSLQNRVGLDYYLNRINDVSQLGTAEFAGSNYGGSIAEVRETNTIINSDTFLRYETNVTDDYKISTMVGANFNHNQFDILYNIGRTMIVRDLVDITHTKDQVISRSSGKIQTIGVFGELTNSYKNMLFVTLTGRNDWNSKLAAPRGYAFNKINFFYPSVSSSFVFSELMNDKSFFGKLKASYAQTANVPAGAYATSTLYNKTEANFFGNSAYYLNTTLGNSEIKPEKVSQWEVGTELGFMRNKIVLEGAYYEKKSENQIIEAPVSQASGFTRRLMNLGEIQNKGFEITLKLNDIFKTDDVRFSTEFNFTRNRNKVIKVSDQGQDNVQLDTAYYNDAAEFIAKVGQPIGAIYGYDYLRNAQGTIIVDPDGKPIRNSEKTLLGDTNPDFVLGMSGALTFKGFKFGYTTELKYGGQVFNDYAANLVYAGRHKLTDERYYDNDPVNNATRNYNGVSIDGTPVNRAINLTKAYYNEYSKVDSNFVENATWWRLRNIYLGYAIPKKYLDKLNMGITNLEFTFSGRNLLLITNYSGIDPEVNSLGATGRGILGLDSNSIPNTRSFDFGVKLKF
jgi:TonB-linked SusC/RagA family outer membrane protein